MFKFLSQNWATIGDTNQATWETRADQGVYSTFNAYMSFNQSRWRDFQAPSQHDPPDVTDVAPTTGTITCVAGVRSITLTIPVSSADDGWGIAVFRGDTTAFASAFDNLIGIGLIVGTDDVVVVDTPLEPDAYFYNFRAMTIDGQLGAELGEETDTVV